MADVILGCAFRANFGLQPKYSQDLDPIYKGYIDTLEHNMITATYGTSISAAVIVQTMNLNISQEDIDNGVGDIRYSILEPAIISFCQKHDVELFIQRNPLNIVVTVNMLNKFHIIYT